VQRRGRRAGLAIVEAVARAHDGTARADGAGVWISLSAWPAAVSPFSDAGRRDARVRRVSWPSTIWVYENLAGWTAPRGRQRLTTATKAAGEMYCTAYAELYSLELSNRLGIPVAPVGHRRVAVTHTGCSPATISLAQRKVAARSRT
jgi:hypothetical protein